MTDQAHSAASTARTSDMLLLEQRVAKAGQDMNVARLQLIADSGILQSEVPPGVVRAIWPLIESGGYDNGHSELIGKWIEQCAQSDPDTTAGIVCKSLFRGKVGLGDAKHVIVHGLETSATIKDERSFISNHGNRYKLVDFSLISILALDYSAGFSAITAETGLKGNFTQIPPGGRVVETVDDVDRQIDLNLVELLLLGKAPKDPIQAAVTLHNGLGCLNLSARGIQGGLTDSIINAHKLGMLDPADGVRPVEWVVLLLDAGCEVRDDLVSLSVPFTEYEQPELLLHAICSCPPRDQFEFVDTAQFVGAARRLISEGGADPNRQGADGATPFHRAIFHENKEMVEMLLGHGADPAVAHTSAPKLDALTLARNLGYQDIEAMILAWSAKQAVRRAIGRSAGAAEATKRGSA